MTRGALVFVSAFAASYAVLQGGLILLGAPMSAWTHAGLVLVSVLAARGARRLWP